jgi:hypothetical protein
MTKHQKIGGGGKSLVTNDGNDKEIFNTFCTNLHPVSPSIEFELNSTKLKFQWIFEFHSMYINLIHFYRGRGGLCGTKRKIITHYQERPWGQVGRGDMKKKG